MAVAGVIAEYNPFHLGHSWQIDHLRRRLGEETAVVTCMSGNFVQRGDFAILAKHARAEAALRGGADLVLELPTPWSAATAERFAQGGTAVLAATGVVTHLVFGCECGDLAPLQATADCLDSPAYAQQLQHVSQLPFASARQAAVRTLVGEAAQCLSYPNNALAVEYLRALNGLIPLALPRTGAAHDSLEDSPLPSASAIRQRLLSGRDWRCALPLSTSAVLDRELACGRAPVSMETCQRAILARLRMLAEEDFLPYDGGGEGLYHRFFRAVHSAASIDGVLAAAKTRRYPLARLRRMLLQSYLGVPQAPQGATPPYLRVLGANERGRALLSQMRKTASLPIITKPGHVRRMAPAVQQVFELEARCTDLYVLARPNLREAAPDQEYTIGPVML